MWQFISGRFWVTIGSLVGLTLVVALLTGQFSDDSADSATGAVVAGDQSPQLDFVAPIAEVQGAAGFAVVDGRTTADLALTIDTARTMVVRAGTPGQFDCPDLTTPGACLVGARLMGDAVLWFSVVPSITGATGTGTGTGTGTTDSVKVPAVVELLPDGWVRLANGWVVRHASVVDRFCESETSSLTDFIDQFGANATATFDLVTNEVVKVSCPRT